MATVKLLTAEGAGRRILHGMADGVPIIVTLDSSAAMKLLGNQRSELEPLADDASIRIADAAQRIIVAEQRIPPRIEITALDLD